MFNPYQTHPLRMQVVPRGPNLLTSEQKERKENNVHFLKVCRMNISEVYLNAANYSTMRIRGYSIRLEIGLM